MLCLSMIKKAVFLQFDSCQINTIYNLVANGNILTITTIKCCDSVHKYVCRQNVVFLQLDSCQKYFETYNDIAEVESI